MSRLWTPKTEKNAFEPAVLGSMRKWKPKEQIFKEEFLTICKNEKKQREIKYSRGKPKYKTVNGF